MLGAAEIWDRTEPELPRPYPEVQDEEQEAAVYGTLSVYVQP